MYTRFSNSGSESRMEYASLRWNFFFMLAIEKDVYNTSGSLTRG
jgi:hypothetical protein